MRPGRRLRRLVPGHGRRRRGGGAGPVFPATGRVRRGARVRPFHLSTRRVRRGTLQPLHLSTGRPGRAGRSRGELTGPGRGAHPRQHRGMPDPSPGGTPAPRPRLVVTHPEGTDRTDDRLDSSPTRFTLALRHQLRIAGEASAIDERPKPKSRSVRTQGTSNAVRGSTSAIPSWPPGLMKHVIAPGPAEAPHNQHGAGGEKSSHSAEGVWPLDGNTWSESLSCREQAEPSTAAGPGRRPSPGP
jgi:hypothetical protein